MEIIFILNIADTPSVHVGLCTGKTTGGDLRTIIQILKCHFVVWEYIRVAEKPRYLLHVLCKRHKLWVTCGQNLVDLGLVTEVICYVVPSWIDCTVFNFGLLKNVTFFF